MDNDAFTVNFFTSEYLNGVALFGIYLVLAVLTGLFINKALMKLAKLSKSELDDRILETVRRPIALTIIIYGFKAALPHLGADSSTIDVVQKLVSSGAIFIWTIAGVGIIKILIENAIEKNIGIAGISKDIMPLAAAMTKTIIFIVALVSILAVWSIDITPIVASAGVLGAIIALAAKDTIANFLGGVSIFLDKPYQIGDYIELDQRERGEVVEIGVRSTRIRTRDDILIAIPNSIIANTKIVNESAPIKNFRVRIPIGLHYGTDIDIAQKELVDIARSNKNILSEPEPRVRFRGFGDSRLEFELLCWADEPAQRGLTIHEINCAVYKRFNEIGIEFPFPQREIKIKNMTNESVLNISSKPSENTNG